MVDLVLKGGNIIDGNGNPAVMGDVVINDGSIISIIDKNELEANFELDVKGKIIPVLALGLGFHPELTAITNIFQSSILLGFKKEEISKRVEDIIKFERYQSQ